MEVYDEQGLPLDEYDLDKGYLKEDTRTVHHDAAEGVREQGHWETTQEYPNGGKDVKWVVDVPGVEAQEAWDEQVTVQVYVPYTEEELAVRAREKKLREERQQRETVMQEAQAVFLAAQINTLSVDDTTALRWRMLYPEWTSGTAYAAGERVRREDKLYRCLQGHTAQAGWEPESAASLWTEICETHAGTAQDPIPYSGNMALEAGKHYSQNCAVYRCTRDTGIPVYNALAELAGIYVEAV